jgi:LytS/YehU family sensor histidine kinase
MIAPLLLLPFLENSLTYCNQQKLEKAWINLDIKVDKDDLFMKLVNGKSAEQQVTDTPFENGLSNVNKRLQLLYPGNNELRLHAEPEVMMTYLKIKLEPLSHEGVPESEKPEEKKK